MQPLIRIISWIFVNMMLIPDNSLVWGSLNTFRVSALICQSKIYPMIIVKWYTLKSL